jgi:arylsulfatase A-like enzyme
MKVLDEQGLTDQSLLIFTNDNGGERYSDNGGLAKSKASLWEGGIRVPAFARWPGKIAAGSNSEQTIITMDWTATILAAANAKTHMDFALDGINLLPLLTGRQKEMDRTFYWRTFQRAKQKAIREGKWKYLQDENEEYLFDLLTDPGEKNNLKAAYPVLVQRLKTKYEAWEKTVLKPIPL